jgi:hypothetical protein
LQQWSSCFGPNRADAPFDTAMKAMSTQKLTLFFMLVGFSATGIDLDLHLQQVG